MKKMTKPINVKSEANNMTVKIEAVNDEYRSLVNDLISENWGSTMVVSHSRVHHTESLPGYFAAVNGEIQGVIIYCIENGQCEIVVLDSMLERQGIGGALIKKVIGTAKGSGCSRVWLVTSNDNTHAFRFYQKRGFDLVAVHRNAIDEARKIKPCIPMKGFDGIPIKHEIEFELQL